MQRLRITRLICTAKTVVSGFDLQRWLVLTIARRPPFGNLPGNQFVVEFAHHSLAN